METIDITIKDGNVDINVACEPDNFMSATSVMFAYMVQNSSNTFEELLEVLRVASLEVVEKNTLKILQALRDIPDQDGSPVNVVWPVPPWGEEVIND